MRKLMLVFFLLGSVSALAQKADSTKKISEIKVCLCSPPGIKKNLPLYLIDGKKGNISDVSADNILSVNILKGDSTVVAKYGSAGANGVVIITTKNAKINTLKQTQQK